MPIPSEPMVRDKMMRYKNPNPRSQIERAVTTPAILIKVFLLMLYFIEPSGFLCPVRIYYTMLQLKVLLKEFYVVKEGDTLQSICSAANVSPTALMKKNNLSWNTPLFSGMLLFLPPNGNLYTVQPGDTVELLCGSKERFEELNGTADIYPGKKVRI